MQTLLNPFKLFVAIFIFFLKITGYTLTFAIQTLFFAFQGKPEMIIEAFGFYGRDLTDAFSQLFK